VVQIVPQGVSPSSLVVVLDLSHDVYAFDLELGRAGIPVHRNQTGLAFAQVNHHDCILVNALIWYDFDVPERQLLIGLALDEMLLLVGIISTTSVSDKQTIHTRRTEEGCERLCVVLVHALQDFARRA